MKYTARTISKSIFNGLLTVEVEFRSEDGKDIFNDKFLTTDSQDSDWLETSIKRKLSSLESLEQFIEQIPINITFEVNNMVSKSVASSENMDVDDLKEVYKQKIKLFNQWKKVYVNGIIDQNNKEFAILTKWLNTNFKPEYIDLF